MTHPSLAIPGLRGRRRIQMLVDRSMPRLRRGRPPVRCVICGTRLCSEDAIGLVQAGVAHAECALVHMFESPTLDQSLDHANARTRPESQQMSDEQWRALLAALFGELR